ncbi:MAG: thioredoxin domain-containing protein [Gemmatimonadetes bacterium]|nr:thioredoxin domain-containing protein [Gemmatimonadota bacterium]
MRFLAALAVVTGLALLAPAPAAAQLDPMLAQRTKGKADAPITVYELSDFQCPFCRKLTLEVIPELDRDYVQTGKVRWIFVNLPLTQIHPNALAAAEFAMCSARLGKFWPAHDLLFQHQPKWAPLKDPAPFLLTLADSMGVPRADLVSCLQGNETRSLIQGEAEGAARSGVASTPTLYVDRAGLIPGAQPVALYRQIFDSLYKERTGGR